MRRLPAELAKTVGAKDVALTLPTLAVCMIACTKRLVFIVIIKRGFVAVAKIRIALGSCALRSTVTTEDRRWWCLRGGAGPS
jgi:hypothetical protein